MSIKTFAHKGVEEIFLTGRSRRIGAEFRQRMSLMLDAIDGATCAATCAGLADSMPSLAIDPEPSRCRSAAIGG